MGKSSFTPHRMLNCLTFFKPCNGPNQHQIGQSQYQSTLPVHSEYKVSLEVRTNVRCRGTPQIGVCQHLHLVLVLIEHSRMLVNTFLGVGVFPTPHIGCT